MSESGPRLTKRLAELYRKAVLYRKRADRAVRRSNIARKSFQHEIALESKRQGMEPPTGVEAT